MREILARAVALYQGGDADAALALLSGLDEDALPLAGLALKANIYAKKGAPLEAGEAFLKASRQPGADRALFLNLAARMFSAAGAGARLAESGPEILDAIPQNPALARDVISACLAYGRAEKAVPFLLRLDLADPQAVMLGINILRTAGRSSALLRFLEKALAHHPDDGMFNAERFNVAQVASDFETQAQCLAMIRDPGSQAGRNMFSAQGVHRRLMWSDDEAVNARPGLDHFLLRQTEATQPLPRRIMRAQADGPLKIAYLSNDFYNHATMVLIRQVLIDHDPRRVDFRLFSYVPADRAADQASWPDALKSRIVPVDDTDDLAVARAVAEWKADILVDLKGFTGGSRPGIVRLSNAPLKVTWIGYPGPVSGIGLDYAITDRIVTPDSAKPVYEERLCRLPECYQPNDCVSRPLPGSARRADEGLPPDAFVFASFNATMKITRDMLRLWSSILARTPGSIFWCYSPDADARANLLKAFAEDGIAAERIVFAGSAAYPAHIARIALADLVLDTLPYNGHTTSSDTLWAGVPFLTLMGHSFASRVSASLLTAVGLPELITGDAQTYVERAVDLWRDSEELVALRARLAENRRIMPLFDSERFARHLETAYEQMAARARAGLPPEHIDVAALPPRETPFF